MTIKGVLKKFALQCCARLSSKQYINQWKLPQTWSEKSWYPFFVASWETLNETNIKPNQRIVFHPGTNYDQSSFFDV
jgi:hypothetical protein